jgi:hypothetical protein
MGNCGLDLAIPYRVTDRPRLRMCPLARPQGAERAESQQGLGGGGAGPCVPWPWRCQAQVGAGLRPGHVEAPPGDQPRHALERGHRQVWTSPGWGCEGPMGGAH